MEAHMITANRLREVLHYDEETGIFTWKVATANRTKVGSVAASRHSEGYLTVFVDGKSYKLHRLAWLYQTGNWPVADIDHINCVKDDNRFSNLRESTRAENSRNRMKRCNNKSGFKGVCWDTKSRKWRSRIMAKGEYFFLGYFHSPEEAHTAYCAAAEKLHGEFARPE